MLSKASQAGIATQFKMKASGPNSSITYNGHPYDEILSCIQKYIRRSELGKALYVGIEADLFSLIPATSKTEYSNAKSRRTNFINRLRAIIAEEVGIASPALIIEFDRLYQIWQKYRDSVNPNDIAAYRKALVDMITLLVKAKKIRLVSDVKAVYFNHQTPEIIANNPEYGYIFANAENTIDPAAGKYPLHKDSSGDLRKVVDGIVSGIINKSDSAFYWVAKLLHQREGTSCCPANDNAVALLFTILGDWANGTVAPFQSTGDPRMAAVMEIMRRYYYGGKDIGFQGKRDCWLYIILPVLYAVRPIDFTGNVVTVNDSDPGQSAYDINLSQQTMPLDEYCFDIHTKKGKKLQKSVYDFAQEGALVTNQEDKLLNQDYRKIYVYTKLMQMGTTHAQSKDIIKSIKYSHTPATVLPEPIVVKKMFKIKSLLPKSDAAALLPKSDTAAPLALESEVEQPKRFKIKQIKKLELDIPKTEPKTEPKIAKTIKNGAMNTEQERFSDVVRAQLTCSANRPDVYFAVDNETGARVVVKGPFMDMSGPLNNALFLNSLKGVLDKVTSEQTRLREIPMYVANLIPDMWSHVPIGLRNKLKTSVKHPFLIMEDVCHKDKLVPIKTTKHGSKLWAADTIIFDSDESVCGIMDIPRLVYNKDNELIMDMLTAYAFRYIFEVVDTCDRNFIINWITRELYSIDEENYGEGKRTYFVGNKPVPKKDNRQTIFSKILDTYQAALKDILKSWRKYILEHPTEFASPKMSVPAIINNIDYLLGIDISSILF